MFRGEFERKEKPFEGKNVYFSASLTQAQESTFEVSNVLVRFMVGRGANVLDDWLGGRTLEEVRELFRKKIGIDLASVEEPWKDVRRTDLELVDQAEYVVAEITFPSHGVGMEIQRAIDKDRMGLNHTKILCLYNRQIIPNNETPTWMISGVSFEEHKNFHVAGYTTIDEAQEVISEFLTDML